MRQGTIHGFGGRKGSEAISRAALQPTDKISLSVYEHAILENQRFYSIGYGNVLVKLLDVHHERPAAFVGIRVGDPDFIGGAKLGLNQVFFQEYPSLLTIVLSVGRK